MAVVPFLGLRGSESFATNERPEAFREMYLYLYPNGSMPITALQGLTKSSKSPDPKFHWFEKDLAKMCADVTSIKTSDNNTTYSSAGSAGDTIYIRMSETDSMNFRTGYQGVLIDSTDPGTFLRGKIVGVFQSGASSWVQLRLYEADGNGGTIAAATATDIQLLAYGNVNAEGGNVPDTVMFNPYERENVTQIFRTPLEITRTAKETRLRTVDQYKEAKREALEIHGMMQEWTQIWGIYNNGVGANNQPERSTRGLIDWVYTYAPENVYNYTSDTDFAQKTWEEGGLDWFEKILEEIFLYGDTEKLCVCGSKIIAGVQKLVRQWGHYTISTDTKMFGYQVVSLTTPFGVIHFKSHPLMRYVEATRRLGLVFEPRRFERKYITDTMYKEDVNFRKGGFSAIDALKEEYLTECGYEYHNVRTASVLLGVGSDNTASAA